MSEASAPTTPTIGELTTVSEIARIHGMLDSVFAEIRQIKRKMEYIECRSNCPGCKGCLERYAESAEE